MRQSSCREQSTAVPKTLALLEVCHDCPEQPFHHATAEHRAPGRDRQTLYARLDDGCNGPDGRQGERRAGVGSAFGSRRQSRQYDGLTSPEFAVPKSRFLSRAQRAVTRLAMWSALGAVLLPLDGCAVVALPCRVTAATLKILPVVGHAAATPFDVCAAAID
jgi:hypothetical protein